MRPRLTQCRNRGSGRVSLTGFVDRLLCNNPFFVTKLSSRPERSGRSHYSYSGIHKKVWRHLLNQFRLQIPAVSFSSSHTDPVRAKAQLCFGPLRHD
jgi:hypothetical protein